MASRLSLITVGLVLSLLQPVARGAPFEPSAEEIARLERGLADLSLVLQPLRRHERFADADVHRKALDWLLRHREEFFDASLVEKAERVLARGLERALALAEGKTPWTTQHGRVALAYRSRVDDSVQPYAIAVPSSYQPDRPLRLDVILHGRNGKLSEVGFLHAHDGAPHDGEHLELHVYGRGNNAYRWAGETDVLEAITATFERYSVDGDRVVLRGFSMGGAGAWHLGLHFPHYFAAFEAGAGFTETRRYANRPDLPLHELAALRIYDAVEWSLNGRLVPFVGYGGEKDKQLQASVNIRERLQEEGFRFENQGDRWTPGGGPDGETLRALFLVGPDTEHRWHPKSLEASEAFLRASLPRNGEPHRIRFLTCTLAYAECHWLRIEGMDRHHAPAEVDARLDSASRKLVVTTRNVQSLHLAPPGAVASVEIDSSPITLARPTTAHTPFQLERQVDGWKIVPPSATRALRKRPGLQGPIDDAFRSSFLVVRPTGRSRNSAVDAHLRHEMERFRREFAKWMRGDVRVTDDVLVSRSDIEEHHLVLFGDLESNAFLRKVAGGLPVEWSPLSVKVGSKAFPAATSYPVLIYPNPFNPERYVVVNSGHTFGEREFQGTNALLYPRHGDWAVLSLPTAKAPEVKPVLEAGFFDERWEVEGELR